MVDDITLKILQQISECSLPMNTVEAQNIAPLSRFKELEASGLITAGIICDNNGDVVKVRVSGITHTGRAELESRIAIRRSKGTVAKSLKVIDRLAWLLVGVGMTLFGLWAARQLGLK